MTEEDAKELVIDLQHDYGYFIEAEPMIGGGWKVTII